MARLYVVVQAGEKNMQDSLAITRTRIACPGLSRKVRGTIVGESKLLVLVVRGPLVNMYVKTHLVLSRSNQWA
jgi:hypothetical protein